MGIQLGLSFNSTTVQLILISQSATAEEPLFQFHNGTINTADGTTTAIQQRTFQFHNGTINTFTLYCISSSVLVFQFHNGTINTIFFFDSVIGILCFNSTTVQLILLLRGVSLDSRSVSIPQRYN